MRTHRIILTSQTLDPSGAGPMVSDFRPKLRPGFHGWPFVSWPNYAAADIPALFHYCSPVCR